MKIRMTCLLACMVAAFFLIAYESSAPKTLPNNSADYRVPVTTAACPAMEACASGKIVIGGLVILKPTMEEEPAARKAGQEPFARCYTPDCA